MTKQASTPPSGALWHQSGGRRGRPACEGSPLTFAAQRRPAMRRHHDFEVQMVKNRHCQLEKLLEMLENGETKVKKKDKACSKNGKIAIKIAQNGQKMAMLM